MEKQFCINGQGFSVQCKLYYNKDIRQISQVVISTYGFGGNKENRAIARFAERITTKYKGYGVVCFDWPCHGADARNKLILEECLTYLDLVVDYAKEALKAEHIYTYSTSFGGYVTLKYMAERYNPFRRIAFRCPAVKMYDIMIRMIPPVDQEKLARGKEILMGHDRKIRIYPEFLQELKDGDLTKYEYFDYADDILILHGTRDESVPIEDSRAFAEANVIEMIPVEKADHPFSDPHIMDTVIARVVEFFAP